MTEGKLKSLYDWSIKCGDCGIILAVFAGILIAAGKFLAVIHDCNLPDDSQKASSNNNNEF